MQAMIFAAGLGTRLKPLTDTKPKALVTVKSEPLIGHLMKKLKQSGCKRVVVNVHHFAEMLKTYLAEHNCDMEVAVSDESDQLLDTGGGLRHAAHLLPADEPFLVHNVDIMSNLSFDALMRAHDSSSLATLVVSPRKTSRYLLFDADNRLVGWTNIQTGEVKSPYDNLDVNACRMLAFAGIQAISPRTLQLMNEWPEKFSIIDFYLHMAAKEKIMAFVPDNFKMMDIGKLDTLAQADAFVDTL
ncbi:MAG: nucleotidyltransferase family protein [Bacteroidales bacterium]|nr:nucleotidyltransferase family protein [Bacteroidales bacterium]